MLNILAITGPIYIVITIGYFAGSFPSHLRTSTTASAFRERRRRGNWRCNGGEIEILRGQR